MRKIILFLSLLLLGCKSLIKVENLSTFNKISTKNLINQIDERKPIYNFLALRSQATIIDNNSSNQFNLGIRIQKNEKILVSGSLFIPLFKGLFTKDNISFYEKINQSYYIGNYQYLSQLLSYKINLQSLQNILLGQPVADLNKMRWEQQIDDKSYILQAYSKESNTTFYYKFNPLDLTLRGQAITTNETKLTIEYDNYKLSQGYLLPQKVNISAYRKGKDLKILLNLKVNKSEKNGTFPFLIPKDYKEIKL